MFEKINHYNERNVGAFFLLTFIYSWSLWLPFVLAGIIGIKISFTFSALRNSAVMLGAFAPLLAAVTMIARKAGWPGVREYFRQAFNFRAKRRYFALAFLLPLIITAATHYIVNFMGIDSLPRTLLPDNLPAPFIVLAIVYFMAMMVAGGGQEEFGWRGYAQEPLQQRFGMLGGSLVLGVIWGLWHLPLWFLPGEGHANYPFLAFLLYIISLAVIMGWLFNASGKKLVITWIAHAMGNTVAPLFPVLHMAKVPQPGYWLWAGLHLMVALGLTIWSRGKHIDRCPEEVVKENNQRYSLN